MDHDSIRALLPLAAAGAASPAELATVRSHVEHCSACRAELGGWDGLAVDLRALPTPEPPEAILRRLRSIAATELSKEAERRANKRMLAFLVLFAWLLTCWPVIWWQTGAAQSWLHGYARYFIVFLMGYTILAGITATVAVATFEARRRATRGGLHEPIAQ